MKHKKHLQQTLIAITLICSLGACDKCSFKTTSTGLRYKIAHQGKGPKPQDGEVMLLDMCYQTEDGKTLFNSAEQEFPIALQYYDSLYQKKDGGLQEAISMLQKGDSIIFKLAAQTLLGDNFEQIAAQHNLQENDNLLLHLSVKDIMQEGDFRKWEEEQYAALQTKWKEKAEQQLQEDIAAIDKYLQENKIVAQATDSGLRYVIDEPGHGPTPQPGDTVKVSYTGKTLEGKVFDTSLAETAEKHDIHNPLRTYEPIEFKLGEGRVIPGWEEGIRLIKKGGKARLFIPSTLAYGAQAAGTHIKPNAILMFEVELVNILR